MWIGLAGIFEIFFTTKAHGMGMGLSVVRSIVEAHGGRLSAENKHDMGATLRFSLPMAGDGKAGPAPPHHP